MRLRSVLVAAFCLALLLAFLLTVPSSATETLVASYGSPYRVQYNYNSQGFVSNIEIEFITSGGKPTIYTCRRPNLGPCVNEIRLGEVGCYEFVGVLSRECDSMGGSILCGTATVSSITFVGAAHCE